MFVISSGLIFILQIIFFVFFIAFIQDYKDDMKNFLKDIFKNKDFNDLVKEAVKDYFKEKHYLSINDGDFYIHSSDLEKMILSLENFNLNTYKEIIRQVNIFNKELAEFNKYNLYYRGLPELSLYGPSHWEIINKWKTQKDKKK